LALTVLNVAYPLAPIGPDATGGAEQIVTQLDAALSCAQHRSIVIAAEGSITLGELIPSPFPVGRFDAETQRLAARGHARAIQRVLEHTAVDVIHLHGIDAYDYVPAAGPPVIITLHLPPQWYPPGIFQLKRPQTYLHCVSATQRRQCPPGAALLPTIENGVAPRFFDHPHAKRRWAMALGRVCPEKGFHLALDAAARIQIPLLLAGQVYPYSAHEAYFRAHIVPRLDRWRRFLGPIGWRRKRRLLSAARCLLVPSLVPETSSLVALEALACGTPVVAFPAGALVEIIEHGRTGFIVADEKEMGEAILACAELDPAACQDAARSRFALAGTMRSYLSMYEMVVQLNNRDRQTLLPVISGRETSDMPSTMPWNSLPTIPSL